MGTIKRKNWAGNLEKAASGVSNYEADRIMESQYGPNWRERTPYGDLERDRLVCGEPEIALLLLPWEIFRVIQKGLVTGYKNFFKN